MADERVHPRKGSASSETAAAALGLKPAGDGAGAPPLAAAAPATAVDGAAAASAAAPAPAPPPPAAAAASPAPSGPPSGPPSAAAARSSPAAALSSSAGTPLTPLQQAAGAQYQTQKWQPSAMLLQQQQALQQQQQKQQQAQRQANGAARGDGGGGAGGGGGGGEIAAAADAAAAAAGGAAAAAAAAAAAPVASTSGLPPRPEARKEMWGDSHSIHGEAAAKRRAVAELIFFAGVNDLRRCRQIAATWAIDVADVGCMDYDRRTPLHICAAEGAFSVAQWLLDSGADPNPPDRHGRTPLEEAVRHDHAEVARLLQAHRARVMEDGHLVALEASRLRGLVNTRAGAMADIGWDPEWEVSPKELKLIERIGGGEFGEVYKAKWHGSYVAAKVLKRSDEIALGDFRTEIAILRKISHPNCVQFLGACTKQRPYIVLTELMACSLADAFARTFYAPTPRRQVEVALDFARGMAYLHSRRQPIVHRDLKPANLMISGNLHADSEQLYLDSGVIKVADFGLSKSLVPVDRHGKMTYAADQVYKLTGETGSYRYMAPEVFRHEPYSLKVDVYSFAMILFQLFETTTPFAGHDPVDAARQAAMLGARPGFPPRKSAPAVTEELRRLVDDCWAADPEARPSFEDVVARLERMLRAMPKHAHYSKGGGGAAACCGVQ